MANGVASSVKNISKIISQSSWLSSRVIYCFHCWSRSTLPSPSPSLESRFRLATANQFISFASTLTLTLQLHKLQTPSARIFHSYKLRPPQVHCLKRLLSPFPRHNSKVFLNKVTSCWKISVSLSLCAQRSLRYSVVVARLQCGKGARVMRDLLVLIQWTRWFDTRACIRVYCRILYRVIVYRYLVQIIYKYKYA